MGLKEKRIIKEDLEQDEGWSWQTDRNLVEAIFNNTDTLIVVLDKQGRIKKFNQAAERLSGYRFTEIKDQYPWQTFLPEDEAERIQEEAFNKLVKKPQQRIGRYVNQWESKSGKRYLTEWSNTVLLDDQGQVEYIVAVGSDITERKVAEEALVESEKRFWTLFDNAPEAIVVLDADQQYRFIDANQNACQLFKMDREELLQKSPIDVSPPLQADGRRSTQAAIEVIRRALDGVVQHFVWTHRDSLGQDIACEVYLVRLPSSSGRRLLRGSVVDIRARKRAEDALRESEERMDLVIQGAEVATWDWNLQTEEVVFNKRWSEMLGFTENELTFHTNTWEQRVHPDDKQRVRELAELHVQGKTDSYESEYRMQHKSGQWIWVLDRGKVTERDPQGKALRISGTHLDITERKRAENDLQASEKLYRALIEASPDVVVVTDTAGQVTFASSHIIDLLGLSGLENFIGSSVLQWVVEEDRERAATNIKKRLAGEEVPVSEYRILKENGEVFYAEINSCVLKDESSQASGMVAFVRDISESKNAEMRQADLAGIVEKSLNEIYIIDQQTLKFLTANRSARENIGYTLHELSELTPLDIKPEFTLESLSQLVEPLLSGKSKKMEFETVHLRKNGTRYPVETHLESGTYAGRDVFITMVTDITERKRYEEERERVTALLVAAIEQSPSGILIADAPDVKIRMANSAAFNIRGGDKKFLTDIDFNEHAANWQTFRLDGSVYPGDELPLSRAVLKGETTNDEELIIQDADDTRRLVSANAAPIKNADGEVVAGVVVFHDISERKHAEEQRFDLERQVQHAQKLESLGILAGGIAHDFNNILMSILGFSDLALMQLESNSTAASYIRHVVEGGQKAAELAQQMLAYSGKGRFDIQLLDLSELVREMAGLLDMSVSKKCLLRYEFTSDLPGFEADATQIRQVVMNLIINASDAIGEVNGVIVVRTDSMYCDKKYLHDTYTNEELASGSYVYLEVSDTGIGMDENERQKIFDPFYTTKFTGRGLGLAAVLGIVRGHHGAIKVQSEPNGGSTFRVLFPIATESSIEPKDKVISDLESWQGQGTALVIDDEEAVRRLVRRMLETMGFSVLVADDGEHGLEEYQKQADSIDLIVIDMTMPRMDGEETLNEIRKIRENANIVLTSGYDEHLRMERYTNQGHTGFIQKPYRYEELVEVVRDVVGE